MTTKTVKLSPVASLEITARYYLVHEDGDIMADKATFHPKVWTLEEYENAKKWLSELTK